MKNDYLQMKISEACKTYEMGGVEFPKHILIRPFFSFLVCMLLSMHLWTLSCLVIMGKRVSVAAY